MGRLEFQISAVILIEGRSFMLVELCSFNSCYDLRVFGEGYF